MRGLVFCLLALAALASACAPKVPTGPATPYRPGALPTAPALGRALPAGTTAYNNASLADLLVTLTHDLEWGASRPHLIRFDGPIAVGVTGAGQPYLPFLDGFLAQLRNQTGINISRGAGPHNLVVRFVPGREFRAMVPQHFCVVAPGLIQWDSFKQSPIRYGTRAYETQATLAGMTIFIPDNAQPHVVRTCLIEEVVQALGPANDLYGLGPSIFNDDAAHIWPTRLDYLMLRVLYAPEVRAGMNRRETRDAALQVLARLNPAGIGAPPLPRLGGAQMADWQKAIRAAFDPRKPRTARIREAERAFELAARQRPGSAFHCRAADALIRVGRQDGRRIMARVANADQICAQAHGADDIRVARIKLGLARLHYDAGNPAAAVAITEGLDAQLAAHGHDERLTALYALRAAALGAIQQSASGIEARRRAGAWGAYALGSDHPNVRRWRQQ